MTAREATLGLNSIFAVVFLALVVLCGVWMWGWYHSDAVSQSWVLHVAIWALALRFVKDALKCISNITKFR